MKRNITRKSTPAVLQRSYPPFADHNERCAARAFGLWLNTQLLHLEEQFGSATSVMEREEDPTSEFVAPEDFALLDPEEE